MQEYAVCPCCSEVLPVDGPGGVLVHLIAFHAKSPEARWVMQQIALMDIPAAAR